MDSKQPVDHPSPSEPAADPLEGSDDALGDSDPSFVGRMNTLLQRTALHFMNVTYGLSSTNLLDSSDGPWLLQSPVMWNVSPDALPEKHSHFIAERIRKTIEKAENVVDITTLYPAPVSGVFFDELAAGLAKLVAKNRPIIVRILIGQHMVPEKTEAFLAALVKKVPSLAGSKLKIFAAAMTSSLDLLKPTPFEKSWNHSKIVAVDGRWAIVGGHNLWDPDYLCSAPAHDVSLCVRGRAAWQAHQYCNYLWAYVSRKNVHGRWPLERVWSNNYDGPSSTLGQRSLAKVETTPETPQRGKTKVFAIGRMGHNLLENGGRADHSDLVLLRAIDDAKHFVRLSLQDLAFVYPLPPKGTFWPEATLKALANAVLSGEVHVQIVLSTPGSTTGSDTGYSSGVSIQAVWNQIAYWADQLGCEEHGGGELSHMEVLSLLHSSLEIVPIRFKSGASRWTPLSSQRCGQRQVPREIANHAKVMIIDDRFFYVGSQNLYTSDHQEYGWIVEGEAETREFLAKYWEPLWKASAPPPDESRPAASGDLDFRAAAVPPAIDTVIAEWADFVEKEPSDPAR